MQLNLYLYFAFIANKGTKHRMEIDNGKMKQFVLYFSSFNSSHVFLILYIYGNRGHST